MTDRVKALTVVLERDTRVDDVEALVSAIRQFRGVIDVQPIVTDLQDHVAAMRAKHEFTEKLLRLIADEPEKRR